MLTPGPGVPLGRLNCSIFSIFQRTLNAMMVGSRLGVTALTGVALGNMVRLEPCRRALPLTTTVASITHRGAPNIHKHKHTWHESRSRPGLACV